jgi:hypothetical protein
MSSVSSVSNHTNIATSSFKLNTFGIPCRRLKERKKGLLSLEKQFLIEQKENHNQVYKNNTRDLSTVKGYSPLPI